MVGIKLTVQNHGLKTIVFLGDRARYPFKFRNKLLVTTSIVVADIKEKKPQSISTTAVFLCRPIS